MSKLDSLKIELGPRSLEQAADDLEQIARAVRSGALWSLSPHLLNGGSVQMVLPEPEEVKFDPKPVVHEPTEAPISEEEYDKWFRDKVKQSLEDEAPRVSSDKVMAKVKTRKSQRQ